MLFNFAVTIHYYHCCITAYYNLRNEEDIAVSKEEILLSRAGVSSEMA